MNHIVGFITGHSVRGCTGLSQQQRAFQRLSNVPQANWLRYNFPWKETFPFPERLQLLSASINNVSQYLCSQTATFRAKHRTEVVVRLEGIDAVILLAGSCGLELLNNLKLPVETRRRLHVFAYGPVSRRQPDVASYFLVQGDLDLISQTFHREVDARIDCAHMDYLERVETLRLFEAFYRSVVLP